MKTFALAVLVVASLSTALQAQSDSQFNIHKTDRQPTRRIMHASFPDGTMLEIFTGTTGSTPIDAEGGMGIGPGAGHQDMVNRIVVDRAHNILFAYNLEASRGATPDTVKIRIDPISPATEASYMEDFGARTGLHWSGAHFPTVAAVREFPAVKMGEAVTLDILSNPSTGERIYDVLRPIAAAAAGNMYVQSVELDSVEDITLEKVRIRLNGKELSVPDSLMRGRAVRIDIPGHGAWVLAAYDQKAASLLGTMTPVRPEGKTLSWTIDGDHVEITSGTDILSGVGAGVLWVYHDAHFRSQDQPDAVRLQAAESVERLLPKR
jgi:hypothetical protein